MTKESKRTVDQTRLWIIVTCVVLILALSIGALFFFSGSKTLSKDKIAERLETKDLSSYSSVANALSACGISFNKQQMRNVELVYDYYYYKELPSTEELTRMTAEKFLDEYYDLIDVKDRAAVTTALLKCYVASVGDPYSYYFTRDEYTAYIGDLSGSESKVGIGVMIEANYLDVTLRVATVLPGSAAEAAGIKRGDYIVAVDGTRIEEVGIDGLTALISGEIGTSVEITVLRGDEELIFTATRAAISDVTVTSEMLEGNIAYVQVIQFKENTPKQFKEALDTLLAQGAVGIVFDMRNNPGGVLDAVVDMIDYIAPDGKRIASYTIGKYDTTVYVANDGHSIDLPITVLCNGGTASAGELFTAAMRDYGEDGTLDVSIVGETTYKKGVMQQSMQMNNGEGLKLTVAFYNPPCDINYDGVGVLPSCPVTNDGEGDDQLEMAVAEIQRMLTDSAFNDK